MTDEPGRLRYAEDGNVHLDFHGATNTTIDFIVETFGVAAMDAIFAKVGHEVYASIREDLIAGDSGQLVRHWRHFYEREGAAFEIAMDADEIVMTVHRCTAWHHVKALVGEVSPHFCDQTIRTNEAMAEGAPFALTTEITGEGSCRQILRRRA
jgi:hypothetical protein